LGRTLTFTDGESYYVLATGVIGTGFAANPSAVNTDFDIVAIAGASATAPTGTVGITVFHGSTDAPAVAIDADETLTLVASAQYKDAANLSPVPVADYTLDLRIPGTSNYIAGFQAPLSTLNLGGTGIFVFATGFVDFRANNIVDQPFELYAVTPTGQVVQLPSRSRANLQILHNAADPAVSVVDVYINGELAIPEFEFRTATEMFQGEFSFYANNPIWIGFAPANSTSFADTLVNFELFLGNNSNNYIIANGVVGSNFAANPDGESIGFDLLLVPGARPDADIAGEVDVKIFHGSTDAPTVEITSGATSLVPAAGYGEYAGYIGLPAGSYPIQLRVAGDEIAEYTADISGLGDQTVFVFASGFVDPTVNSWGQHFGLFALLTDGTVLQLPSSNKVRAQFVHNAADPAVEVVDAYLNGKFVTTLRYRGAPAGIITGMATGFMMLDLPFNALLGNKYWLDLHAPGTANRLARLQFTPAVGDTVIYVVNGVATPANFTANPDGRNIGVQLFALENGRTSATNGTFDVRFFHGVTDAPAVDAGLDGSTGRVVEEARYGDYTAYLGPLPTANYVLDVYAAGAATPLVSFDAPISAANGQSVLLIASGFLSPGAGQKPFQLLGVLPIGLVVGLVAVDTSASISDYGFSNDFRVYPNPLANVSTIELNLSSAAQVSGVLVDMNGRVVSQLNYGLQSAGTQVLNLNAENLVPGIYSLRIQAGSQVYTSKLVKN
jgi:hypothetical protein